MRYTLLLPLLLLALLSLLAADALALPSPLGPSRGSPAYRRQLSQLLSRLPPREAGRGAGVPHPPVCPTVPTLPATTVFNANTLTSDVRDAFARVDALVMDILSGKSSIAGMPPVANPALSVRVMYRDTVLHELYYGNVSSGVAVGPHTPYRSGSITKVMSVLLLMTARAAGGVDLDDPIAKTVPGFGAGSPGGVVTDISWRSVAGQISGLAGGTPCDFLTLEEPILHDACILTNAQAWARMKASPYALRPMFERPFYSDVGYAALGRALEDAYFHEPYETAVINRLMQPLGMSDAFFDVTSAHAGAIPAAYIGNNSIPAAISQAPLNWAAPTGQMYASVHDLSKLVSLFLDPEKSSTVPAELLRQMLVPSFINPDRATGYGFPFEWLHSQGMLDQPKQVQTPAWIIGKAGAFVGFTSAFSMAPDYGIGVAVGMNNMLASYISDIYIMAILDSVASAINDLQPTPPNPGNLNEYVGLYSSTFFLTLTFSANVTVDPTSPRLVVDASFGNFTADWISGDTFRLKSGPVACMADESGFNDDYLVFVRSSLTGSITGLQVPSADPFYGSTISKTWSW